MESAESATRGTAHVEDLRGHGGGAAEGVQPLGPTITGLRIVRLGVLA